MNGLILQAAVYSIRTMMNVSGSIIVSRHIKVTNTNHKRYLKFVNNKDIELVAEHTLYKHYRREEFLEKMYKKIKEKVK